MVHSAGSIFVIFITVVDGFDTKAIKNFGFNIGFGDAVTHTRGANDAKANLPMWPLSFPLTHPTALRASHEFDAYVTRTHFGIGQRSLPRRATRKLRRWTLRFAYRKFGIVDR